MITFNDIFLEARNDDHGTKFTDVRNSHNEISNTYMKNGNKYKVEKICMSIEIVCMINQGRYHRLNRKNILS